MSASPPQSCLQLLQRMVGFNTVNSCISGKPHAEQPLAIDLETLVQSWGFKTQRLRVDGDDFNLLVTYQPDPHAPWLLFDSHLDTVSVQGMSIDPFAGQIKDGKMWGRGSCDTKSSGAAMLWALKQYTANQQTPNNIAILFSIDEEIGKAGVIAFAEKQLPALDWQPAGVIVGEPTEMNMVVAHNGIARWTIQTHGRAAHSADPARGQSAISAMAKLIIAIEEQYIPQFKTTPGTPGTPGTPTSGPPGGGGTGGHPLTGKAQCSLNMIQGGTQINIIPESCKLKIDRRVVPGEQPDQAQQHLANFIDQYCAKLTKTYPGMRVSHHDIMLDPPLDPATSAVFASWIGQTLRHMQLPDKPLGVAYGTNASNHSAAGVPAVVLGPGHINQAHTHDEWLDLTQLELAVEVYRNIMLAPLATSQLS